VVQRIDETIDVKKKRTAPTTDPYWYEKVPTWAESSGGTIAGKPVSAFEQYSFQNVPDPKTGLTPIQTAFLQVAGEKERQTSFEDLINSLTGGGSGGSGGGRSVAPGVQELADILFGRAESGAYKAGTEDLKSRLVKQSKRARKDIRGGYQDLISNIRSQTNPYRNMEATNVDVTSGLQDVLAAQGVGSGLLQEQMALLGANEASRQGAYNDLADVLRGTWRADRAASLTDARANRRTALDALRSNRSGYSTQIAAQEEAAKDQILQNLLDLLGRGANLPAGWQQLFGGK
jgi:hypothetical protein